ncbi:MAG: hypothetical protein GY820_13195 [Gammaproteobacteria bacterium]|nr:hypothetical protein [Gammaproteobacteria bacterium]
MSAMGDAAYRVEWKPVEAGEHYIDVRLFGQSVHHITFPCNVGDPDLVTVRSMPTAIKHTELGETHHFESENTFLPCRFRTCLNAYMYVHTYIQSTHPRLGLEISRS